MDARRWPWILVALLLLLSGWSAWETRQLAREVERLRSADTLRAPAPRPDPAPGASSPALSLGAPAPAETDLVARMAEQDQKIAHMLAALDRIRDEWKASQRGLQRIIAAGMEANELAAIAVGRNVNSAMAQVQASAKCDVDQDGTGEYMGFLEASGASAGRLGAPLVPPVLSSAFRALDEHGAARRNGYLFRIYLPGPRGQGVGESQTGFEAAAIDADLAETTWCLYAWPVEHGATGTRTFFVNQGGDTLFTDSAAYSGPGAGPAPDAAFLNREHGILGAVAIDAVGVDGNRWSLVR